MPKTRMLRPLRFACLLAALVPTLAGAKVINVEFKFTPFTGDTKNDTVDAVPGLVRVFVNDVPFSEQPVQSQPLPVMFDEREIAAAAWVPTASIGPILRKDTNTIRFEFEPTDAKASYTAQLRWASVTDQVRETDDGDAHRSTNQADEGVDQRQVTGLARFERTFTAEFATDRPWHHLPPVTSLGDDDKRQLAALVQGRAAAFAPPFAQLYTALTGKDHVDIAQIRKLKCLDAAHAAGVRIVAPPAEQLDFVTTGHPEVVIRGKRGNLFGPGDEKPFDRIKGERMQMCAAMTLATAFPPHLVAVRSGPSGAWQVVE